MKKTTGFGTIEKDYRIIEYGTELHTTGFKNLCDAEQNNACFKTIPLQKNLELTFSVLDEEAQCFNNDLELQWK